MATSGPANAKALKGADEIHSDTMTGPSAAAQTALTQNEARVLGTLMEKARTVPDSYPLSLSALMAGCNQKTSREPVMALDEAALAGAIDNLRARDLVRESSGGRTARYAHNFQRGIGVYEQAAVLLGMLMLRGPQTAGELRLNTERWYPFADISSVEGFLQELLERGPDKGGPLVVLLPRTPGTREQRWAHLLCGPIDTTALAQGALPQADAPSGNARIEQLEREVAQLRETVERLCVELGVAPPVSGAVD